MDVLRTEEDFYELAYHYFRRAAAQNVVYVEPFFNPQAHTSRGVAFDTVISGIHRAQQEARESLGVHSNLMMCFLRGAPCRARTAGSGRLPGSHSLMGWVHETIRLPSTLN